MRFSQAASATGTNFDAQIYYNCNNYKNIGNNKKNYGHNYQN